MAQLILHKTPVIRHITAPITPIAVKNGAAVPARNPSTATMRKNSAARFNFTGLIGFSVIYPPYPARGGVMSFDAAELRALSVELGNVPKVVGPLAKVVVKKTAKDIESTAKTLAPVDTGFLRSGIKTSDLRNVSQESPSAEVVASASYSPYLEFGTSRMAPQPFMRPAADKHADAFEQAMAHIIEKAVNS